MRSLCCYVLLSLFAGAIGSMRADGALASDTCADNEVFLECGVCEQDCIAFKRQPCSYECREPGCYCPSPLKRDLNGACVPQIRCPQIQPPRPVNRSARSVLPLTKTPVCRANEVYMKCGVCERSCFPQTRQDCSLTCQMPACYCRPSFMRDIDGSCVPEGACRFSANDQSFPPIHTGIR